MSKQKNPIIYESPENLAIEHWDWLQTLLQKVYCDAFVHGYKHGQHPKRFKPKYS